jgi:exodeoxyribonuclease-1
LSEQQQFEWEEYRQVRLLEKDGGGSINMEQYFERLNQIAQTPDLPAAKQIMLQDLADYAQSIYPIPL